MALHLEHLLRTLEDLGDKELKTFQWFLCQMDVLDGFSAIPRSRLEKADRQDTVDQMVQTYGHHGALEITLEVLGKIDRNDLVQSLTNTLSGPSGDFGDVKESLEKSSAFVLQPQAASLPLLPAHSIQTEDSLVPRPEPPRSIISYQHTLQSNLQNRFMCVPEALSKQKDKKQLDDIYTELYVTEGCDVDINCQHEVRQIEMASRHAAGLDKSIKPCDIFKHPSGKCIPIRTVLTNGIAGIGKTFLVYKFILDWAEGKSSQDVHLTFPFTFRQLNLLKGKRVCFTELIHTCIRETIDIKEEALNYIFTMLQTSGNSNYDKSNFKILFVLDGLDESRLQLDFTGNDECSVDITESTSVDVLLTNLIKGKLLPSARLWITTRPAAANQLPEEYIDMVTEVRGFIDPQKEEYFRKRFTDETLADRIISHIKASRSLHIMCHIPVFCWITATVLEDVLRTDEKGDLPKTLTEMYTKFLVFQIKQTTLKYGAEKSIQSIRSLAKLAFHQLENGNLIFYERDLKKSGINFSEASVYSGVFTQIFKEEHGLCQEPGLYQDKVFSFVHLSIQEFLAAVYVVLSLINSNKNVLYEQRTTFQRLHMPFRKLTETEVQINAVDKALQSGNGHLDLFLRFLLGLSLETNQTLLQGLLKQTESSSKTKRRKTVQYIKKKIRENPSPERTINLFHCLNELNDHSLVEEIQRYLRSGSLSTIKLPPAEWSALAFVLLTSEEALDIFDLRKYSRSEEGLLRMLPVVKASTRALLSQCELSDQCCEALASVLNSPTLREMDLRANELKDSGVKLLSAGLGSPHCRLETLRLSGCLVTEDGCASLASALTSNPSHLRELDLSHNNLHDLGVKFLLSGVGNLNTLRLKNCGLTEACCHNLASSLTSSLRELDLSNNDLQDSGVKLLSAGLGSPQCRLETLSLSGCLVTEEGCASLASALSSNPSHLRELDLSYNHPGDSGVKLLSAGLEDPHWRLETLSIDHCGEFRIQPGPRKYACELTLDPNTAHRNLSLSEENRKVTGVEEEQSYPDHPERFDSWRQVLCREGLTGCCYWEVECTGVVDIGVTYKSISREGRNGHSRLGWTDKSWSLYCNRSTAWHNGKGITIPVASSGSDRVGVYLDWPAGTLSFYTVSSGTPRLLHTFHSTFTEPVYPGFWVVATRSSAFLCL